ncbi:MAG TPA: protease, partial [Pedococcus sp.]|nr:protease [Pedococcus sp.]
PQTLYRLDGTPWRTRIQIYDAPFSLTKGDSFTLHFNGQASYIRGVAGNPLFDDTKNYFDTNQPEHGVKLPAAGVKIRVLSENGTSMRIRVS